MKSQITAYPVRTASLGRSFEQSFDGQQIPEYMADNEPWPLNDKQMRDKGHFGNFVLNTEFTKQPDCGAIYNINHWSIARYDASTDDFCREDFLTFKFSVLIYFGGVTLRDQMIGLAKQAKAASRELAKLTTAEKNACLIAMAEALEGNAESIKTENAKDMAAGAESGLSPAMLDRLKLDDKRIAGMAKGLREVAALPDPVGRILDDRTRPNGLKLQKVSTPIGVVVIIYESRPNVTADAASLCFKSGNATILRGGKEAIHSNQAIARVMLASAKQRLPSFPEQAIQVVQTTDRDAIKELLSLTEYVDLCMPRGGEGLIRAVAECSKVPVIKHYKGVCHVYVDGEADTKMAEEIILNGKVQRPGVCNAIETLLVDKAIAPTFLPAIAQRLTEKKVELRVDEASQKILGATIPNAILKAATEEDWFAEYLDLILAVRVVNGVKEAIDHINHYGSAHSDSIVTRNEKRAKQFLAETDSATVYWNASTRFTDGGEFGMGAEIGISTDKIGARGPMGLEELTTYKWIGIGNGQIRA
ncbi:gamma-glutamyl phosphate reductase [Pedosphaera parvula Ellin514]|uniref:Gamma-glutamyl phosphate reductase n=1 Tax=Pedosphaera parvula (strain Ellin514) TaxID=320771 RepID=B9X9N4_PEDPL|nr:gamma-glutamyl phosphate reductase [Pedosphaera parvula Ellin514]